MTKSERALQHLIADVIAWASEANTILVLGVTDAHVRSQFDDLKYLINVSYADYEDKRKAKGK